MKLKSVQLPHPQPNGGFWDTSLGGGLELLLHLAELVAGFSESGVWDCFVWSSNMVSSVWTWLSAKTKGTKCLLLTGNRNDLVSFSFWYTWREHGNGPALFPGFPPFDLRFAVSIMHKSERAAIDGEGLGTLITWHGHKVVVWGRWPATNWMWNPHPPDIHLASTRRHSRDWCSQAFLVFLQLFRFRVLSWTQTKEQGTRLGMNYR